MYCCKSSFYTRIYHIVPSMLFLCVMCFTKNVAHASGAPAPPTESKPPSAASKDTDKKSVPIVSTPFPRKIRAPEIKGVRLAGGKSFDYSRHRLTVLVVLASWSSRSSEVTKVLNKYHKILTDRGISVQGIFTQDTIEAIHIWKKNTVPKFDLTLVSSSMVDDLKNPKIPTFYVVNKSSEFIHLQEMPTDPEFLAFVDKLLLWTDF